MLEIPLMNFCSVNHFVFNYNYLSGRSNQELAPNIEQRNIRSANDSGLSKIFWQA
jgi:hypothetical protein